MKRGLNDKAFDWTMVLVVGIISLVCLLPMIYILSVSFSSNMAIAARKVLLWPVEFNVKSYSAVLTDKSMVNSMIFTIWITLVGTALSLIMTILCAYPLTKKNLKGRNFFLVFIVITMYFGGGMIPEYLLVKQLGMIDKPTALIIPYCLSAFNMIILKTFFSNLPESLEESAYLDGASHLVILTKIVIPLSTPVLATLALFYAVGRWNGFQDALIYISKQEYFPLQMKLYQLIYNNQMSEIAQQEGSSITQLAPESLKAAAVMFATVPILLVYPWLQRYFISGVMVGAIKG
jgi:putative aldouronate transport system permease protein